MLNRNGQLRDRLERLFARALHIEVPSAETDLIETGLIDSLTFVTLLVELEREFGARIPLAELELEQFRSLSRIAAYLEEVTA